MNNMQLYATQISQEEATQIAPILIEMSQWFSIEPLPDERFELQVKAENQGLVAGLLFNFGD